MEARRMTNLMGIIGHASSTQAPANHGVPFCKIRGILSGTHAHWYGPGTVALHEKEDWDA